MPSGRTDVTDIVLKRGTAARWAAVNPVLKQAEPGFAYDTGVLKIGDGVTAWNSLAAINVTAGAGITRSISVVSTNTTAGATAATDYVYIVTGTTTLTLPNASGNTNLYTVKNGGLGTVTIATTSAQTIDGSASAALTPNTALDLISDGSNWRII